MLTHEFDLQCRIDTLTDEEVAELSRINEIIRVTYNELWAYVTTIGRNHGVDERYAPSDSGMVFPGAR